MEEELNYSTVVFKNAGRPPKEANDDTAIYSTVKTAKEPAHAAPNAEPPARSKHFCLLAMCFGILCVLCLVSISFVIYLSVITRQQETSIKNLEAENQQLVTNSSILQTERDNLTRTLGVIRRFNSFPVNEYCPQTKCQPCRTGWVQFKQRCYLFYDHPAPWKTWQESRQICQNAAADLVVINDQQEQEFVSKNIKLYFDDKHGYWLGLTQTANNNWVWVDGRNDTLGYWMTEPLGTSGPCALIIPNRNFTANWDPAENIMQNKFICEIEALTW